MNGLNWMLLLVVASAGVIMAGELWAIGQGAMSLLQALGAR